MDLPIHEIWVILTNINIFLSINGVNFPITKTTKKHSKLGKALGEFIQKLSWKRFLTYTSSLVLPRIPSILLPESP